MIDIKKLFGKRVKELRIKKGYTQEKLAELIDVGERNLSKIECGKCFVKAETIAKLLYALDVNSSELFDFSLFQEDLAKKENLKNAIDNDLVDIDLMYRIYRSVKF
ncbi:helix-turn-helix transcriptional regulator [bacterium]|nr:helix-turn-helix transcriptional regulator [bacterium]